MEDFILSVLAGLATSYIAYLCSKIKNHLFNGRRKSGYEFELKFKFKNSNVYGNHTLQHIDYNFSFFLLIL